MLVSLTPDLHQLLLFLSIPSHPQLVPLVDRTLTSIQSLSTNLWIYIQVHLDIALWKSTGNFELSVYTEYTCIHTNMYPVTWESLLLSSTPISVQCHQLCSPNDSKIFSPFLPHCYPHGDSQEVTWTEASELDFLTPHLPSLEDDSLHLLVSPTSCRMKSKFFRMTSKVDHGLAPTSLFRSISCDSPFLYCPKL